ncbi:hypothetical protein BH23BAC2_BH23BAC2_14290 [soil metagenome]
MGNFFNNETKKITGLTLAIILFALLTLKLIFNW